MRCNNDTDDAIEPLRQKQLNTIIFRTAILLFASALCGDVAASHYVTAYLQENCDQIVSFALAIVNSTQPYALDLINCLITGISPDDLHVIVLITS